jgi:hypothetical protein
MYARSRSRYARFGSRYARKMIQTCLPGVAVVQDEAEVAARQMAAGIDPLNPVLPRVSNELIWD